MAGRPPRILDNLPDDGRPWRLTVVGGITRIGPRRSPMVELHFAPFTGNLRSRARLMKNDHYDWSRGRIISASASELAYFTVGSLWTAGTPEEYPDYEQLEIELDIKTPCRILRAHDRTKRGNYVIPRQYYHIPKEMADARVAVFPLPLGGTFGGLIIPCSEIFRFYYLGPSGKLGRAFLDGTYLTRRYEIVSEQDSIEPDSDGYAYIRLGKCIDNDDRVEIARVTFYQPAMDEVEALIPRAISGAYDDAYPIAIRPPFRGKTRLRVRGKRIRIGQTWAFLVFVIEQCSAPMPFLHLGFNRQNPSGQGEEREEDRTPAFAGSQREAYHVDENVPPNLTQSQDPAARDVPHKVKGVISRSRYTALFDETFIPRGPIRHRTASVIRELIGKDGVYATGTVAPRSTARALSFGEGSEPGLSTTIANFKNLLTLLRAESGIIVESIEDRPFMHGLRPGDRTVPSWFFLDGRRRQQPRLATVAIVWLARRPYIVIEIDRKPRAPGAKREEYFRTIYLSSPVGFAISAVDVRGVLTYIARTEGVIKRKRWGGGPFDNWPADGLWHFDVTAARRAKSLHAALAALPAKPP